VTGRLVAVARAILFVLLALVLCGLIFEAAGYSSLLMFQSIVDGAFLGRGAFMHSLRWALPLFLTATGVLVAFRCGYFNVGAQGQFYLGAIGAAFAIEYLKAGPPLLVIVAALLAGTLAGALWALWPGLLRIRSGTDETITTLMANFIAGLLLIYVTSGPLKDPSGSGQMTASRPIPLADRISGSNGVSPTIIAIVVLAGLVMWLVMNRTAFGVLGGLTGRNPTMVRWQGASLERIGLAAFLFSGALAGLAGGIELLGPGGRLVSGFSPAHGFTAILIALVAGLSVIGVAVVALFFGGLAAASLYLPVIAGLPAAAIDIINAAVALFITARTFPGAAWLTSRLSAIQAARAASAPGAEAAR
jgi:ABC-type uncharacterized transport system permease subunit